MSALSDPTRREILELLRERSMSAGEISSMLQMKPSAVSYHLSYLYDSGLICRMRQENRLIYRLNLTAIDELIVYFVNLSKDDGTQSHDFSEKKE
ncbi:metalloregulator ArsR/SmtB family transcription factor [Bifidobacterium longum]|uniref:metalloregulator ArsR/SmtB family transcription factor n=1 Tax=Bifidobacterium longum TaxID=216816 RepID=UPI001BE3D93A